MTALGVGVAGTAGRSPIRVAFGLHTRLLVTRIRIIGLGALGLIAIIIGISLRFGDIVDPAKTTYDSLIAGYCLGVLAPVTSLVFASAAYGDLVEDGTLGLLWLKPVARWRLVLAAFLASCAIAVPVSVVPATLAAMISGTGSDMALAAAVSTAAATAAYCGLFVGIGLLVRRALVWGLAYVLIWEHAVARNARGAARLSVFGYANSLGSYIADRPDPKYAVSWVTAVIVLTAVSVAALAVTIRLLSRADVP